MGPGPPEEQRVGRGVGARAAGVPLHQRAAAVGHVQPQRPERAVLQHPGGPQPHRSPALPPRWQQRPRAAQKVTISTYSASQTLVRLKFLFFFLILWH